MDAEVLSELSIRVTQFFWRKYNTNMSNGRNNNYYSLKVSRVKKKDLLLLVHSRYICIEDTEQKKNTLNTLYIKTTRTRLTMMALDVDDDDALFCRELTHTLTQTSEIIYVDVNNIA